MISDNIEDETQLTRQLKHLKWMKQDLMKLWTKRPWIQLLKQTIKEKDKLIEKYYFWIDVILLNDVYNQFYSL